MAANPTLWAAVGTVAAAKLESSGAVSVLKSKRQIANIRPVPRRMINKSTKLQVCFFSLLGCEFKVIIKLYKYYP
jgi:hypothetical protein